MKRVDLTERECEILIGVLKALLAGRAHIENGQEDPLRTCIFHRCGPAGDNRWPGRFEMESLIDRIANTGAER